MLDRFWGYADHLDGIPFSGRNHRCLDRLALGRFTIPDAYGRSQTNGLLRGISRQEYQGAWKIFYGYQGIFSDIIIFLDIFIVFLGPAHNYFCCGIYAEMTPEF